MIDWYENENVFSCSSGGVYYDSVCKNDVYYVYISAYAGNGKSLWQDIHDPHIIESESKVYNHE